MTRGSPQSAACRLERRGMSANGVQTSLKYTGPVPRTQLKASTAILKMIRLDRHYKSPPPISRHTLSFVLCSVNTLHNIQTKPINIINCLLHSDMQWIFTNLIYVAYLERFSILTKMVIFFRNFVAKYVSHFLKSRQLQGGFAPDQGFCPWTPLGAQPQAPIIGSRFALAMD